VSTAGDGFSFVSGRKGGALFMQKYDVSLCSPTILTIEAESEDEAKRIAVERYKQEHDTWIDPEIHDIHACFVP
jgi:hypothetical protein